MGRERRRKEKETPCGTVHPTALHIGSLLLFPSLQSLGKQSCARVPPFSDPTRLSAAVASPPPAASLARDGRHRPTFQRGALVARTEATIKTKIKTYTCTHTHTQAPTCADTNTSTYKDTNTHTAKTTDEKRPHLHRRGDVER